MRFAQACLDGCAVITGEKGTGKTTLLDYLIEQTAGSTVRIDFPPSSLPELGERMRRDPKDASGGGARTIVFDNAHLFSEATLTAILLKTLLPHAEARTTRLVLAGEPDLERTLQMPVLASLRERRGEHLRVTPLALPDVTGYIAHRLAIAGAPDSRIFRDETCAEIHRETNGLPRLVNALCDAAMIVACERDLREVGLAEVRRALEDIARLRTQRPEVREPEVAVAEKPVDSASPAAVDASRPVFARLRVMLQGTLIMERELSCGRLRIGRGMENELRIEGRYISRQHCRIVTSDGVCLLEDVHSTNGLYVNEQRVRRWRLRDGDIIQIGEHQFHYVDLRDPSAPSN
jgi:type II secretory pathway predicted ATPase ExeA